jgi:two-component system, LuxR family, sensor kinase FixL
VAIGFHWESIMWFMISGCCVAFGFIHLVIGYLQIGFPRAPATRKASLSSGNASFLPASIWASMGFTGISLSVAAMIIFETVLIKAQTPKEFGMILRWTHVPTFTLVVSLLAFVHGYFRAGRAWLACGAIVLHLMGLILNFLFEQNIYYLRITGLKFVETFGGNVAAVAVGVRNPWLTIMELGSLLALAFMFDAIITSWRQGGRIERRRAVLVGGSLLLTCSFLAARATLIHAGIISSRYMFGFPFLFVFAAIAFEYGADVLRSVRLTSQLNLSKSALHTSKQRMELATKAAQIGIWEWRDEQKEIWASEQCRKLYGVGATKTLDFDCVSNAVHPDDRNDWKERMSQALQTRGGYVGENRILLPDGQIRWLSERGASEINDDGRVIFRGISLDITERKQSNEQFQEVVEGVPNGIIIFDTEGHIVLVNATIESDFGYTREELIDQSVYALIPPRLRVDHSVALGQLLNTVSIRATEVHEGVGQRKDGKEIPIEVRLSRMHYKTRAVILASVTEISWRKRAEQELEQQRNELAHLSRVTLLSQLSGSLAHELNQPLTAILSNAQAALRFLTKAEPKLEEVREILGDIVSDDRRAGEIMQGLRKLLKKGERKKEQLDINETVRTVLALTRSDLLNSNVNYSTDFALDMPRVSGDPVQLQQVLLNLVVNACDAMRVNPSAERQLRLTTRLASPEQIQVCVSDQGHGIPVKDLKRIFEPFYTTKKDGLGLGLSVSHQIIAAHGGQLWAENSGSIGSHVFFTLPTSPARPHET